MKLNIEAEKIILKLISSLCPAEIFVGRAASKHDIELLELSVRREFSAILPEQYIDFLSRFDGVASGGVFIYSSRPHKYPDSDGFSHDFLELNQIAREVEFMRNFLVFGESDQDEYVLDLLSGRYQVRDKQAFDNIFEEFECFDDILGFMVNLIMQRT
ncbi:MULTISPECIES: YrhA family protein [unclassified Pseudomonas]|uniref:YrhA family protein n=1 Tax=unclassified Pseudomonas TaxID=196821 RepID=UPI001C486B79|nr:MULTISPECIES: YrhA family protein [unclassified Pseudomonas]